METVLGGRCPSHSAGISAELEGEEGDQKWALSQRTTRERLPSHILVAGRGYDCIKAVGILFFLNTLHLNWYPR